MAPDDQSADEVSSPPPAFTQDLRQRGIHSSWVLAAMESVPREHFVDQDQVAQAYDDRPLPIGQGQTISQPFIVAYMAQEAQLDPDDRVLEIGTGSGYGAAVLAQRAASVVTVERLDELALMARSRLSLLGLDHVEVVVGDGTLGWPAEAPYDAIIVTAAGPRVPQALLDQLAEGGRLVIPVGGRRNQRLVRVIRSGNRYQQQDLGGVRFVPLIGVHGRRR